MIKDPFGFYRKSQYAKESFRLSVRDPKIQRWISGDPVILLEPRHGESYGNQYNRALRAGTLDQLDPKVLEFVFNNHGSRYPLSDQGILQADALNSWYEEVLGIEPDFVYCSTHQRAEETFYLGLLSRLQAGMSRRRIKFHDRRTERNWGLFEWANPENHEAYVRFLKQLRVDPLHVRPPGGESLLQVMVRAVYPMIDRLRKRHSMQVVVMPGHGEVNWMERYVREHMSQSRFLELDRSEDPKDRIHNGSVLAYTRLNPETGELSEWFTHWAMFVPWAPQYETNWTKIDFNEASRLKLEHLKSNIVIPERGKSIYVPRS